VGMNKAPLPMAWTAGERRAYAIARAMERTRAELAPVRGEIAGHVKQMGWRRARPLVVAALGRPVQRKALWTLGKVDTRRVTRCGPRATVEWARRSGPRVDRSTTSGLLEPGWPPLVGRVPPRPFDAGGLPVWASRAEAERFRRALYELGGWDRDAATLWADFALWQQVRCHIARAKRNASRAA
jgi:hypothetical protein